MEKTRFIILILMSFVLMNCRKSEGTFYNGITMHPTNTGFLNMRLNGLAIDNANISFFGKDSYSKSFFVNYNHFSSKFTYDLHAGKLTENNQVNADTTFAAEGIIGGKNGQYIGFAFDHNNIKLYNGYYIYPLFLIKTDGKLNISKQVQIPEGTSYTFNIQLKSLPNGNYLMTYSNGQSSSRNFMICFDEELNEKWKVQIEKNVTLDNDYSIEDVLVKNSGIYLLQNKINQLTFDQYRVKKYDFDGNLKSISSLSPKNSDGIGICSSKNGYALFSSSHNAKTDFKYVFSEYNEDNQLLSSKIFQQTTPEKTVTFSNFLSLNDAYYFYSTYGLTKLNQQFELEWTKSLPAEITLSQDSELTLITDGTRIYSISKNNWNDVPALTIIKMDLNGNIVK